MADYLYLLTYLLTFIRDGYSTPVRKLDKLNAR